MSQQTTNLNVVGSNHGLLAMNAGASVPASNISASVSSATGPLQLEQVLAFEYVSPVATGRQIGTFFPRMRTDDTDWTVDAVTMMLHDHGNLPPNSYQLVASNGLPISNIDKVTAYIRQSMQEYPGMFWTGI